MSKASTVWSKCTLGTEGVCEGRLWTCRKCKAKFCRTHWHRTDKGQNVECSTCEAARKDVSCVVRETLYFTVKGAKDRERVLAIVSETNKKIAALGYAGDVSLHVETPDFAEVRDEPGDGEDFEEEELP